MTKTQVAQQSPYRHVAWWPAISYCFGIAVAAGLLSFVFLALVLPSLKGEQQLELGYWWVSSLPILLLGACASALCYPRYLKTARFGTAAAFFLLNALAVFLATLGVMLVIRESSIPLPWEL